MSSQGKRAEDRWDDLGNHAQQTNKRRFQSARLRSRCLSSGAGCQPGSAFGPVSGISEKAQPVGPVAGPAGKSHSDWACQQLACMTAGAEKSASRLRPEKPWIVTEGRGFDSRHLHQHQPTKGSSQNAEQLFAECDGPHPRDDEGPDQQVRAFVVRRGETPRVNGTCRPEANPSDAAVRRLSTVHPALGASPGCEGLRPRAPAPPGHAEANHPLRLARAGPP